MRFFDFIKFWVYHYFIIVANFIFSKAVFGLIFWQEGRFSHAEILFTFAEAFLAALPTFVIYSSRELDSRQMLIRHLIHFVLLEVVVLIIGAVENWYETLVQAVFIAFLVAMGYILVWVIYWFSNLKLAKDINKKIKLANKMNENRLENRKMDEKGKVQ